MTLLMTCLNRPYCRPKKGWTETKEQWRDFMGFNEMLQLVSVGFVIRKAAFGFVRVYV